jgi:hypothetical protein
MIGRARPSADWRRGFSLAAERALSPVENTAFMRTLESATSRLRAVASARKSSARDRWRLSALTGGGTGGNEQLTAVTGVVLIVLLAVLGLSILRVHQLISMHLFVGLLLLGPLAVKMGSTGYRFVRYYTHDPAYRREGPPETLMRLIAPVVVLSTVLVFASGIVLLILGPSHRGPFVSIHKASFVVWLVFTGLHVLGYLPGLGASLRAARRDTGGLGEDPGRVGRAITLSGALVGGLVLAIVLIPQFAPWTATGAFLHHGH